MNLTVNGSVRSVDAKPDTPRLYVLRNELGLVGSRFGCGSGQCGACFVLLDGRPIASCDMPVSFAEGKKVTTIEGLGTDGDLHPVQRALIAGDEVVGATTFRLDEGLDTGPVYGVMTELVRPDDTAGSPNERQIGTSAMNPRRSRRPTCEHPGPGGEP